MVKDVKDEQYATEQNDGADEIVLDADALKLAGTFSPNPHFAISWDGLPLRLWDLRNRTSDGPALRGNGRPLVMKRPAVYCLGDVQISWIPKIRLLTVFLCRDGLQPGTRTELQQMVTPRHLFRAHQLVVRYFRIPDYRHQLRWAHCHGLRHHHRHTRQRLCCRFARGADFGHAKLRWTVLLGEQTCAGAVLELLGLRNRFHWICRQSFHLC